MVTVPVASSSNSVGPLSPAAVLITCPRFAGASHASSSRLSCRCETYKSAAPNPPGRLLLKYSRCPSSERAGWPSLNGVLIVGPRFCADPHGASTLARCETQMSTPPYPPARREPKYRLRPSFETIGSSSSSSEFTTAPRLTGADQSEKCGISSAATCKAAGVRTPVEDSRQLEMPSPTIVRDRSFAWPNVNIRRPGLVAPELDGLAEWDCSVPLTAQSRCRPRRG